MVKRVESDESELVTVEANVNDILKVLFRARAVAGMDENLSFMLLFQATMVQGRLVGATDLAEAIEGSRKATDKIVRILLEEGMLEEGDGNG